MDAKYLLETAHFFLSLNVFLVMFTSSEALCPGLGQLENGTTFFRYRGIYTTFTCNPGFRLLGHVSNSCIRGKWRKPVPVCVASGCHLPSGLLHGSLRTSHNNAAITFNCNKGYKLFGSSLIYCNGKRWNSTMPVCRESDMMSSSLRKNITQMSSSAFMGNTSLSRKSPEDLHRIFYNTTKNKHDDYHSEFSSKDNSTTIFRIKDIQDKESSHSHKELLKFLENQYQHYFTPKDKLKSTSNFNPGEHYPAVFSSIQETRTETPNINVTSWYNLSNMVQTESQTTSNTVTIPFPTTFNNYTLESPFPTDHYPKKYVSSRNAFNSLFNSLKSDLRTTPSKIEGTTRWTQSEEIFTAINNTRQTHSITIQSPILHLLSTFAGTVIQEASTSKSSIFKSTHGPQKQTTVRENLKYFTDHSEYANIEEKPIATIRSKILTSITEPVTDYTQMLPVSSHQQVTRSTTSWTSKVTNNKQYKYSKVVYEVTATQPTLSYKTTAMQRLLLARKPSEIFHGIEQTNVTPPRITPSTRILHTTKANRNQIHHGVLKNAWKRRVWCFYPPLPIHGTFRFLTLKDPLPNQYQYYIQYYCYPGYTMTQGDVYSFCMENGTWSGITPICKDM
ncbi:uncharacterized protein ACMZJ9_001309 [Mantella aurantiaca]